MKFQLILRMFLKIKCAIKPAITSKAIETTKLSKGQKLKNCYLLVPRLLVVSTSGATSILQDAKLTNPHSSSTGVKLFGGVVIFAK